MWRKVEMGSQFSKFGPKMFFFWDSEVKKRRWTKATNLTPECRADIIGIKTYFQTFESLIMASMWVKVLSAIHDTNLVIQCRDATLDVERDNIKGLRPCKI